MRRFIIQQRIMCTTLHDCVMGNGIMVMQDEGVLTLGEFAEGFRDEVLLAKDPEGKKIECLCEQMW